MQTCKRCVMNDSADPSIRFDGDGYCSYCTNALAKIHTTGYFPDEEGTRRLNILLDEVRKAGEGKEYDCIMGISGGLDSAYLAYLGHKWGLRILAFHIDDGFDTDICKENIRGLVEKAGIRLITIRPDTEQFYDLYRAYLRAGVPNLAVPQDNVLLACLFKAARENHISYFLSGDNFALECILQTGNTHSSLDPVNIRDIHRRFGEKPMNKLPIMSSYKKYWSTRIGGFHLKKPLDYIDYNRDRAYRELAEFSGYTYYGGKHLENKMTAFLQLYWLPKKFGVDKRTSHLSSMIVSGQMTREEALRELKAPLYDEKMMTGYMAEVREKLGISETEWEQILAAPVHQHTEYRTDRLDPILRKLLH